MQTKQELMDKYGLEMVLCVNSSYLHDVDTVHGLLDAMDEHSYFEFRYNAENNFDAKQIIPYVVIKNKDENKYFVTKRIKGDERLVGQMSIAVGGHINIEDATYCSYVKRHEFGTFVLSNCVERELNEELILPDYFTKDMNIQAVDVFSDSSTEVSRVHFCLLIVINVNKEDASVISVHETEKLEGQWLDASEIQRQYDKFEDWSKISIEKLGVLDG